MLSSLDVLLTDNCLTDVIKSSPLTLDGILIFERSFFFVIPAGLRLLASREYLVVLSPLALEVWSLNALDSDTFHLDER